MDARALSAEMPPGVAQTAAYARACRKRAFFAPDPATRRGYLNLAADADETVAAWLLRMEGGDPQ